MSRYLLTIPSKDFRIGQPSLNMLRFHKAYAINFCLNTRKVQNYGPGMLYFPSDCYVGFERTCIDRKTRSQKTVKKLPVDLR